MMLQPLQVPSALDCDVYLTVQPFISEGHATRYIPCYPGPVSLKTSVYLAIVLVSNKSNH